MKKRMLSMVMAITLVFLNSPVTTVDVMAEEAVPQSVIVSPATPEETTVLPYFIESMTTVQPTMSVTPEETTVQPYFIEPITTVQPTLPVSTEETTVHPTISEEEPTTASEEEVPTVPEEEVPTVPEEEVPTVPEEEVPTVPGGDVTVGPAEEMPVTQPQPFPETTMVFVQPTEKHTTKAEVTPHRTTEDSGAEATKVPTPTNITKGKKAKISGSYKDISLLNFDFRVSKKGKARASVMTSGKYKLTAKIKIKMKIQQKKNKKWRKIRKYKIVRLSSVAYTNNTLYIRQKGKYRMNVKIEYYDSKGKRKGWYRIKTAAKKYKG